MAVFKARKGLLHGCGCRSHSPEAHRVVRPSVPGGTTGRKGGWQGIPHVESSPIHRLGCSLLPSPAADRLPCPMRGLRGLHYSIRGAMPACDEIKQGRVARALVQGCGRRPAASGTTAWARRRPGGGESARTSRPLTTRRFAATGLSPLPSSLLTLAALLRSHPIRGMEPLPRVSAAERFINLCAFVGTVVATCYPEQ